MNTLILKSILPVGLFITVFVCPGIALGNASAGVSDGPFTVIQQSLNSISSYVGKINFEPAAFPANSQMGEGLSNEYLATIRGEGGEFTTVPGGISMDQTDVILWDDLDDDYTHSGTGTITEQHISGHLSQRR